MTLPLLLQRVREASGPDRELDAAVMEGLGLTPSITEGGILAEADETVIVYPPWLTGSLDAAVALVERVRPGQAGVVSFGQVWSRTDFINAGDRVQLHETCRTPALSMVACLLASLIPQEAHEDDQA